MHFQDVHANIHEKGSDVKPEDVEALESGSEYVFGSNWMQDLDEDVFQAVNGFQIKGLKNAPTGKLGYKVHLLKGLLAFYRNLDTHKNDYPQLMKRRFDTPLHTQREAIYRYFEDKFPLFFMQIYSYAVDFMPTVQAIDQDLDAHRKFAASFKASLPKLYKKLVESLPR